MKPSQGEWISVTLKPRTYQHRDTGQFWAVNTAGFIQEAPESDFRQVF